MSSSTLINPTTGVVATPTSTTTPAQQAVAQSQGFTQTTPAATAPNVTATPTLPPTTPPTNASQVNANVPGVIMPTVTQNTGDISNATANLAGLKTQTDLATQAEKDRVALEQSRQQAPLEQQSQGFLSKFLNGTSPDAAKANAVQQTGINPAQYFADTQAKIAEIGSLTEDYNNTVAQRDTELNNIRSGSLGGSSQNAIDSMNAVDRNFTIALSAKSANINAKTAVVNALRGNFQEAQTFINQAITDATAETKYNLDAYSALHTANSDLFDRLDTKYKDAFNTAYDIAKTQHEDNLTMAGKAGDIFMNAAKQGAPDAVLNSISDAVKTGDYSGALKAAGNFAGGITNTYTPTFDNQGNPIAFNTRTGGFSGGNSSGASSTPGSVSPQQAQTSYNSSENLPFKNATENIITASNVPLAAQRQIRGEVANFLASGQPDQAKSVLLSTAIQKFGQQQATQTIGRIGALTSLDQIQSALKTIKDNGGNTNLLSGNVTKGLEKLGTSNNQAVSAAAQAINIAIINYRRSMTGVAFSPEEAAQYSKLFPDITNLDTLNQTKISTLRDSMNAQQRGVLGAAMGVQNYDKIFGNSSSSSNVSNQPVTSGSLTSGITFKVVK